MKESSPKSKAMAATIVSNARSESDGIEGGDDEMENCAGDMMEAIHSKDVGRFHDALKAWKTHVDSGSGDRDESDGADEVDRNNQKADYARDSVAKPDKTAK